MYRRPALEGILRLDPEKDHQRILALSTAYEFPFDTTRACEFAIFRTLAVPSISALLLRTGEFTARGQKRYDDTDLIISELYEYGYDSARGKAALRRMNRAHGRYEIANEDYLYVMSTFVYEPARWNARFGWRPLTEQEKLATFHFWRAVARRMNIKGIPTDYAAFERYNVEYEREHFVYTPANKKLAEALRDTFLAWFLPKPLRGLGAPAVNAMLDEPLLEAFGFAKPPAALRALVQGSMRLRARGVALLPPRRRPRLRTGRAIHRRSYPHGYQIDELGPQF